MKILFVCKGNVYRSFAAEYFSKEYIKNNNLSEFEVSSAGTEAGNYDLVPLNVILKKLNIDSSKHKKRKVSKKILQENDLVIAMDKYNQKYLKDHFNVGSVLFNEFCNDEDTGIINSLINGEETILHIKNSIPLLFKKLVK